ncbi:thiol-disulfide oxidoreductase DCC family protein [Cerasicoccus maritimus]|uniref:thiol-disulfide oxidoreductase DCC family protein n=1 Tax=Cerasicoccus maritimus TaxID=490089 RepID=UPI002852973A|nr:DCC1-like thiol-disulfide oxidoreductase family protein [Cerasicoccus maritimus]
MHARVQSPPLKPTLLWDGDCGFCGRSAWRLERRTGESVDYAPYQTMLARFPEIPESALEHAVHLVESDGAVYHSAQAIFRALMYAPRWSWANRFYERSQIFAALSEWGYRRVANNRYLISKVL